jgi:hypothetical protein
VDISGYKDKKLLDDLKELESYILFLSWGYCYIKMGDGYILDQLTSKNLGEFIIESLYG